MDFEIVVESPKTAKLTTTKGHIILLDNHPRLIDTLQHLSLRSLGSQGLAVEEPSGVKTGLHRYIYEFFEGVRPDHVYQKVKGDTLNLVLDFRITNLTAQNFSKVGTNRYFLTQDSRHCLLQIINSKANVTNILLDNEPRILRKLQSYIWFFHNNAVAAKYRADMGELPEKIFLKDILHPYLCEQLGTPKETRIYARKTVPNYKDFTVANHTTDFTESNIYLNGFSLNKEKLFTNSRENSKKRFSKHYQNEVSSKSLTRFRDKSEWDADYIAEIRKLYATGDYSQIELAATLGMSRNTITDIINYKTWNPHHVSGLPDIDKSTIPLIQIPQKSPITTQQNIAPEMLDDFKYRRFSIENFEFVLYKPVATQFYFEIYRESAYLGSIQYRYFSEDELQLSKSLRTIYNIRPIAVRLKRCTNFKVSDMYQYLNTISDYFAHSHT